MNFPLLADHDTVRALPVPGGSATQTLQGLSDIRRYFHRNRRPVFFIGPTNFNLLGIERWCNNFHHVNLIDCYDGRDPNVFVAPDIGQSEFSSIEDINNHLLRRPEVAEYLHSFGERPVAVFLMFDATTEALARELGVEIWFPSAQLRARLDDKIETVRVGRAAGVESVPNVLAPVESYAQLRQVAAGLGEDLVLQTAYGDSGHTTFFVSDEADFRRHAAHIVGEGEIKIMRRLDCRSAAIEACVTRHGTIVGPLVTELVGFAEATPYRGGWCGNEMFADSFDEATRARARDMTRRFGAQLASLGYRGYFELDFLIDRADGSVYLGELNPRITGISALTNMAAFAHADAPLFLFHMLEFSGVDYELDVDAINRRWASPENIDSWSQLVIKSTGPQVMRVVEAPPSGIWRAAGDGRGARFQRAASMPDSLLHADDAFFLRITGAGDWVYQGADLGIVLARGRWMDRDFQLDARARRWIDALVGAFRYAPQQPSAQAMPGANAMPALK